MSVSSILPLALDVDLVRAVHHDVRDVVAGDQRLERAEAEDVVADVGDEQLLLGGADGQVAEIDDLRDHLADRLADRFVVELRQLGEVDRRDQVVEDVLLDLLQPTIELAGPARPLALFGAAAAAGSRLAFAAAATGTVWVGVGCRRR